VLSEFAQSPVRIDVIRETDQFLFIAQHVGGAWRERRTSRENCYQTEAAAWRAIQAREEARIERLNDELAEADRLRRIAAMNAEAEEARHE
jgi:hypothetical protein